VIESSIQVMEFKIYIASDSEIRFSQEISDLYVESAKARGTGIAQRSPVYLEQRIKRGNAIIALAEDELAGFCYIEVFSNEGYVSNSGLIVKPKFRGKGLSKQIKKVAVNHANTKYPQAKLFGITTSPAIMKVNSELGYIPVSFKQLTDDDEFWNGCKSCKNYDILIRNDKEMCLCTAMLAKSGEELEKMKHELPVVQKEKNK